MTGRARGGRRGATTRLPCLLLALVGGVAACGGVAGEGDGAVPGPTVESRESASPAPPDSASAPPPDSAAPGRTPPARADTVPLPAEPEDSFVPIDAWDLARRADPPMTVNFFEAEPAPLDMDEPTLERIDALILAAVEEGALPGAALAVGRRGRLVRLRGYGTLDPDGVRLVTPATLYDLASLTKVVGTTTAVMILDEEGRLDLDAPVVDYLPWWSGGRPGKQEVTVRQLLLHRAGLPAFRPWHLELEGREAYRRAVAAEPLEHLPGTRTTYSDVGAITLGFLVEAVSGSSLEDFLQERVFGPLGMDDTRFRPPPGLRGRTAPTELDTLWRHQHVHGVVHDENAHAMGGVAGHAGLFSTAWDLSVFATMMLGGGAVAPCEPDVRSGVPCTSTRADTLRILRPGTVERYTRRWDGRSSRALGWDTPEGRSSAGDLFTGRAFGHTGFTGTSIWMDPELDLFVVLLTNRVNPSRANTAHVALRRAVHDLAAQAVTDRSVTPRDREP